MFRLASILLAVPLLALNAVAAAAPVVRVTGMTPDAGSVLASGQNFHVRVSYESDQPLRLQAAGWFEGAPHGGLSMNPSPAIPAGAGEAIVWVFAQEDTRIDELRVRVCDAGWQELFAVPVNASIEWHAGAPEAPTEAWAAELSAAQERAVGAAMKQEPEATTFLQKIWFALVTVLVPLAFLSTPAYPIFQCYALWKLRGPMRRIAATPLLLALPAYGHSIFALSKGSNLWPIASIFASPVALILVIVVMFVARKRALAAEGETGV